MFESNAPPSKAHVNRTSVIVTLTDGTAVNLAIRLTMTSKLADALNNTDRFLDVLDSEGRQTFIAKHTVRKVELLDAPRASLNVQRRSTDRAAFNPYAVLGVDMDCSPAAIRQAYHDLVRKYHPDQFANYNLPKEMIDYAAAMLVRLNLAYEQIGS